MKALFPDYEKSLNNFASSILKCFGVECSCSSLNRIDKILREESYSNIIVLSYNGLSTSFIEKKMDSKGILLSNKAFNIISTFPASDITSTMSFLSEKTPYEHGFIDSKVDFDCIEEKANMSGFMMHFDMKYESIFDKINNSCNGKAYALFPFGKGKYKNREEAYKTIINLSNNSGKKLIYAYFDNLDKVMMKNGVDSSETIEEVLNIEKELSSLCEKLTDAIVFVISGYGNIDCSKISLDKEKSLVCLVNEMFEIEPRCLGVKTLEGKQDEFRDVFNEKFSDKFLLMSYDEVISRGLFGKGSGSCFKDVIGDFVIVATDKYYLSCSKCKANNRMTKFVSCHGGFTEKEMFVPIIAIKKGLFKDGVRAVCKGDYEEIRKMSSGIQKCRASIRKDLFSNVGPITHSDFVKYFGRNATETCFVYTIEDKVVGFIKVKLKTLGGHRLYNDFAYIEIENVYVKDDYRRRGIGTELVRYVIEYARKRHVKKIEFRAWNFEEETFKFIEKFKSSTLFTVFEIDL